MRDAFASELFDLACEDPRIVLLTGDLGYKLWDRLAEARPKQFLNCGIAEAGMIGTATGLALAGMRPIAYSITPFVTTRCAEQIKVAAYHGAAIIIVGVGSGYSYANLGPSHHSTEDIAIVRAIPNTVILAPGDPWEVRGALREALRHEGGPVYLRLGKKGEPCIHTSIPDVEIGRALNIRFGDNDKLAILSTGTMLAEALELRATIFRKQGIAVRVVSMPSVKPLDEAMLEELCRYPLVVTMEEHGPNGGFGSAVAEWMADHECHTRLIRCHAPDAFHKLSGEREHALERAGLLAEQIAKRINL